MLGRTKMHLNNVGIACGGFGEFQGGETVKDVVSGFSKRKKCKKDSLSGN
jgi:hypothetical protein